MKIYNSDLVNNDPPVSIPAEQNANNNTNNNIDISNVSMGGNNLNIIFRHQNNNRRNRRNNMDNNYRNINLNI